MSEKTQSFKPGWKFLKDCRKEQLRCDWEAERILSDLLTIKKMRFIRQAIVNPYIADIAIPDLNLIVELDGFQHKKTWIRDRRRDKYLKTAGFRIIRFWNSHLRENPENVLNQILTREPSRKNFVDYCNALKFTVDPIFRKSGLVDASRAVKKPPSKKTTRRQRRKYGLKKDAKKRRWEYISRPGFNFMKMW